MLQRPNCKIATLKVIAITSEFLINHQTLHTFIVNINLPTFSPMFDWYELQLHAFQECQNTQHSLLLLPACDYIHTCMHEWAAIAMPSSSPIRSRTFPKTPKKTYKTADTHIKKNSSRHMKAGSSFSLHLN